MTDLIDQQRTALRNLVKLSAERAAAEERVARELASSRSATERAFQEARQAVASRFEAETAAIEKEFHSAKRAISGRFEMENEAGQKNYEEITTRAEAAFFRERENAQKEYEEATWTTKTVFEAAKHGAEEECSEVQRKFTGTLHQLRSIQDDARDYLRQCHQQRAYAKVSVVKNPEVKEEELLPSLEEWVGQAEEQLQELKALSLPKLFRGLRPIFFLLLPLWALLALPAWWLTEGDPVLAAVVSFVAALAIGGGIAAILYYAARAQVMAIYQPLRQALFDAENARPRCENFILTTYQRQIAKATAKRDAELKEISENHKRKLAESKKRRDAIVSQAKNKFEPLLASYREQRDQRQTQAEEKFGREWGEAKRRYETDWERVHLERDQKLAEAQARYERDWNALAANWREGLQAVQDVASSVSDLTARQFPAWDDAAWQRWQASTTVPPIIRFGGFHVDVAKVPHGVSQDPRLPLPIASSFDQPSLLPFPAKCNLLYKATDEGRDVAIANVQNLMARFLTSLPPGKVRFTIIDPVGLGENFAAFMHLADYDEQFVASRIWTEANHVEQRLMDLTGHMETVIQKYLRNQYQTIEEYNAQAGEVAEPFRVLVVANFPVNFSIDAARRLVSIVSSGARCGVYTLISVDLKQPLPQGFNLADLELPSVNLLWKDGRFVWQDPDYQPYPLQLDRPPDDAFLNRMMHVIGSMGRDAKRVEVPFEFIAPAPDALWKRESTTGIDVPLGRAGATKRRHLALGKGTAQHVLIAGKTGSGKSTLLHALITNLALYYSPEEVELYLVDFKKGVEFKTYATHELPHARVVAIESEREFGLSVLQRLDAELKSRANRFRDVGAQDLAGYRKAIRMADGAGAANGHAEADAPVVHLCPRILLIVDEFQEFFVEDDKISQEAALLLDRLVRQGRAFGIHVLLGSQTLGGAYTLARSTIDQMAVRIALQCSEADGHIILSEDNNAARLLTRPGEAIYNDANGLVEGNDPFQVVWLGDDRREHYLQRILELTRERRFRAPFPQIVFEGNAPADVRKNPFLNGLIDAPSWPADVAAGKAATFWLGEAIAIKEPTSAILRPQSGCNLLVVGQQDDAALGILATGLIGLAGQHLPTPRSAEDSGNKGHGADAARFYVFDGIPPDDDRAGYWDRIRDVVPQPTTVANWRDVPAVLAELTAELERRQQTPEWEGPTIYLLVHGLHRFRDLRRNENEFGFSEGDKASPAGQFANLIREGPGLGMHVLVWCDTLNNVMRSFDRQGLREFELRVLFQMGPADSSNLLDSPIASKLGPFRALFHSEERGQPEKFRPYQAPTEAWLKWVKARFAARSVEQPAAAGA